MSKKKLTVTHENFEEKLANAFNLLEKDILPMIGNFSPAMPTSIRKISSDIYPEKDNQDKISFLDLLATKSLDHPFSFEKKRHSKSRSKDIRL